jgi:hypothetical protein
MREKKAEIFIAGLSQSSLYLIVVDVRVIV